MIQLIVVFADGAIMANSYMPRKEAEALGWMKTFAAGIAANPSRYMLSAADGAAIQGAVEAYAVARAVAIAPDTRTAVTVLTKDQARNAAEQLCQLYYSLIKANAGISDDDKIAIGVRPINRGRQRINCPATAPALNVRACTNGRHTLTYHDSITADSKGKPFGATGIQLFVTIDDSPGVDGDPEAAKLVGTFTRNPVTVAFVHVDDRRKATYWARWVSRRGETGPWSSPASMSIAA